MKNNTTFIQKPTISLFDTAKKAALDGGLYSLYFDVDVMSNVSINSPFSS